MLFQNFSNFLLATYMQYNNTEDLDPKVLFEFDIKRGLY